MVSATALSGVSTAYADSSLRFWVSPTGATNVDYSSIVKTYGTVDGAAGADILGISNTNYDFASADASTWSSAQYNAYNYNEVTSSTGAGLGIWGTDVNESPNLFYKNLLYNGAIKNSSGSYVKSNQAATTWVSTPMPINNWNDTGWGDSMNVESSDTDGASTINGLEYAPEIIYGASKQTNSFNASNTQTNIYKKAQKTGYNPTYVSADATNAWTQIYSLLKLAAATEKLKKEAAEQGKTLTTRYDNNNAMTGALSFEKSIRGNMLYVASQIDTGKVKKKKVAYMYSLSNGSAVFLAPESAGLGVGHDTGDGTVYDEVDDYGNYTGNQTSDYAQENNGGLSVYASNNATVNYDYLGVLPYITQTFTGGSSGSTMQKIGGIWKKTPTYSVSGTNRYEQPLSDVDVIIYNTDTSKNLSEELVTAWAKTYGFDDENGAVIAGSDYGNSTNQGFDTEDATENGMAPLCYNQRDYSVDKLSRMAWCFSQVYPELYDGNRNATYGYWVDKVYHVKTSYVSEVVAYMTNQSGTITYDDSVAAKLEERYQEGLEWWQEVGYKRGAYTSYYKGSTRASYFSGDKSAEVPRNTIGIFQPSDEWLANQYSGSTKIEDAAVTVSQASVTYTGKAIEPAVAVKTSTGTLLTQGTDYTVSYSNNTKPGTATVTIAGIGNYSGSKTVSFVIAKASNGLKVKASSKKLKAKKLKKKAQAVGVIAVSGAAGAVTYKKTSGASALKINAKTGKVTVKKKAKKGTYKAKVTVKAAGDATHMSASQTVSVVIKVK